MFGFRSKDNPEAVEAETASDDNAVAVDEEQEPEQQLVSKGGPDAASQHTYRTTE